MISQMKKTTTPLQKLRLSQQWEKARLSYFKSKGDNEMVNELTAKIKGIKKEIEDTYWQG